MSQDPFRPKEVNEEALGFEVPYLSVIGAHMYLANCTRFNIVFVVNLLGRHSATLTRRYWAGIKYVLRYLQRTIDLGLYYP